MHVVGYKEASTWANESRSNIMLKVDKTTFIDNYVNKYVYLLILSALEQIADLSYLNFNSPAFHGSEKIKNKLRLVST